MRKQDWPLLLTQGIEDWKNAQFYWGKADCVHFAVMVAAGFLDYDLIERLGGVRKFACEKEAREYFLSAYGGKIENVFDTVLVRRAGPAFAGRGDIVIAGHKGQDIAGIVADGGRLVAAKALTGFVYLPLSSVKIAWATE